MAKIEIHIHDDPSGGPPTRVTIEGETNEKRSVSWELLKAKKKTGTLAPGAEAMAYFLISSLESEIARRKMPLLVPAPKVIVPATAFKKQGAN